MNLLWGILSFMDSDTSKRSCSTPDCTRKYYAKGYCGVCYKKFRDGPACRICGKIVVARELCKKHYMRWRTHGDPLKTINAPPGTGNIDNGYRRIGVNGKLRREHHLVMEQMIGRALLPHEEVHHKNGQRADNSPGNLELWAKSQPAGQRVTDLVDWAVELLHLYAPEKLIDSA